MNNDRSVSPSTRIRLRRTTLVDGELTNYRTSPRRPSRAPPLDQTMVIHKLSTAAAAATPTAATPTTSRTLTHSPSTFTELLEKNKLLVSPTERTERKIQKRHSLNNTTTIAEDGAESTRKTTRKAVKRRGSTGVLDVLGVAAAAAAASRTSRTPKKSSSRRKSKALSSPKPTLGDSDSLQVDSTQPTVPTKELPRKKSNSSQNDDDEGDNEWSSPKKPSSRRRIKALTSPKPTLGDSDSLQVDSTQPTAPPKELPRKQSNSSQDDDDEGDNEWSSPKKPSSRRRIKALPSPKLPLGDSDSLQVDSTQPTAPTKELPRKKSNSSQNDDDDDENGRSSPKKISPRRKSKAIITSLKPPLDGSDSLLEDTIPPSIPTKELPRKKSNSSQDDGDNEWSSPKKPSSRRKSMTLTSPKPPRRGSNALVEHSSTPTEELPRKKPNSSQDAGDNEWSSPKKPSSRRKSMTLTSPKPLRRDSNALLEHSSPPTVPRKQLPRKKSSSLQDDNDEDDDDDMLRPKKPSSRRKSMTLTSPKPSRRGSNALLEHSSPPTVPRKQLTRTNSSSLQDDNDDDDNNNNNLSSPRKSSHRRKSKTMASLRPPLGGSNSLLEDSVQPIVSTTELARNNSSSLQDDDDYTSQKQEQTQTQQQQQQRVSSDTSSHQRLQSPKLSATLSSNGSALPDQNETVDVATPKRIRRTKTLMKSRTSTASLPSLPFQQNRRSVSSVRRSLNLTAHETLRPKSTRMRPLKGGRENDDPEQDNARKAARDKLASVSWRIKRDSDHGQLQATTTLLKRMASPTSNKGSSSRLAQLRSQQHQQEQPKSQGKKERKDDNSASEKQRRKRTREVVRSQLEGISDRLCTSNSHVGPLMAMRDALLTQAATDESVGMVSDHQSQEHHPTFREIFEMFEAGLHNRTGPAYVPFPSGKKTNEAVAKNNSHVTSAALTEAMRPQVDLACLIRHVMLLNEFKDLTSPNFASANTTLDPSSSMSSALSSSSSKARLSLFHRMFQLKCVLLSIMGDDETSEEILPKLQALHDQFDVDPSDLKFVLEHIALCLQHQKLQQQQQQQQQQHIRWDLIQSMFFPEDDGSSLQGSMRLGDGSPDAADLHEEEEGYEEKLSTREALQEVILQLYETFEESMEEWSEAERERRRKVLVELLQATSDEECHQSAVCLEDLQEIARHVRICHDTGAPVEWDLIRALVFPLGITDEPSSGMGSSVTAFSPFDDSPYDHPVEPSSPSRVQASLLSVLDNSTRSRTAHRHNGVGGGDFLNRHDELQNRFGLNKDEVDLILRHIQGCTLAADIRWDLIGNVCFPNDTDRCKLLTSLDTTSTVL